MYMSIYICCKLCVLGLTFPPLWVFYNAPPTLLDVRQRTEQDRLRQKRKSSTIADCLLSILCAAKDDKSLGIFPRGSAVRRIVSQIAGHKVFNMLMVLVIIVDVIHPAPGEKYHIYQLE